MINNPNEKREINSNKLKYKYTFICSGQIHRKRNFFRSKMINIEKNEKNSQFVIQKQKNSSSKMR